MMTRAKIVDIIMRAMNPDTYSMMSRNDRRNAELTALNVLRALAQNDIVKLPLE